MSFLVRQVALKSNGEEIVRTATVEGSELTIGRDAGCGIHLPDLAVHLRHARVVDDEGGGLLIEALGDQPFEVNGRSTVRHELDPAVGAELGFGGHRIQLSRDADSGLPAFTVRRVEALSESAGEKDVSAVYTLKGLLPGKRMSAWTFAVLMLVAFLAVPIWSYATYKPLALDKDARRPAGVHGDTAWSSGQLSKAHANLRNDCQACHVEPFVAVRDNACLTCHTDDAHVHVKDGARLLAARGQPTGFAGLQRAVADAFNRPAGRCVDCHTEHEGAGAMPATQQQFCTDCHDGMKNRLPDTKIADAADFGTAHPQFRPMVIADPAGAGNGGKPVLQRAVWSENLRENNGLKFTHAQHLSRSNGVAQMVRRRAGQFAASDALGCGDCHRAEPGGARFRPVDMEQACQTCHALGFDEIGGTVRTLRHGAPEQVVADLRAFYRGGAPTRPANLPGLARRVPGDAALRGSAADYARAVRFYPNRAEQAVAQVFSAGGMCYDCHTVSRGGPATTGGFRVQPVAQNDRYYRTGWFDHKDHAKTRCTDCHVEAERSNDAGALMIPGLDGKGGCRSCHVGERGARLAGAAVKDPVDSGCAMCHAYHIDGSAPRPPGHDRKNEALRIVADRPRLPALLR